MNIVGERMKDARGVIGMIKYAAKRSRSKFVVGIGMEMLVVIKLMYGAGALTWYEIECDELERWVDRYGNAMN